jgi:hypothetical protein
MTKFRIDYNRISHLLAGAVKRQALDRPIANVEQKENSVTAIVGQDGAVTCIRFNRDGTRLSRDHA